MFRIPTFLVLAAGSIALISPCHRVEAQTRPRPRTDAPPDVRQLDLESQRLQQDYLRGLADLASNYEAAGDMEKTREILRRILAIDPDNQLVHDKLEELGNRVFQDNQASVEVGVDAGWVNTGLRVTKGQPIRIEAQGNYRFIVNEEIGPAGFPSSDPATEIVSQVPAGMLMGVVAPMRPPQTGRQNQPPPQPQPFAIGAGGEFTPADDGVLYLRVNLPAGHRSVGRIRATVSGNIAPANR